MSAKLNDDLMGRLNEISILKKIPLTATFELTYRCPLSCAHCYLPETSSRRPIKKELATGQIKRILSQLSKIGVFSVAFTGGEPLLRKDIYSLCEYARLKGMEPILYTTLFLANEEILKKLYSIGLRKIEVSLYGNKEIHESITKMKGSFSRTLKNILLAKKIGFKIKIKTPVMSINSDYISKLRKFTIKNGLSFSLDTMLTPANDGKMAPENLIVSKEELKKIFLDLLVEGDIKINKTSKQNHSKEFPPCSAGFNTLGINPYGELLPCIQFPWSFGNLKKNSLKKLWNGKRAEKFRKIIMKNPDQCRGCIVVDYCSFCPGISYIIEKKIQPYKEACLQASILADVYRHKDHRASEERK